MSGFWVYFGLITVPGILIILLVGWLVHGKKRRKKGTGRFVYNKYEHSAIDLSQQQEKKK